MADDERKFNMAEQIRFSEDDLTIGDLEDFEEIVGASIDDAFQDGKSVSTKTLKAVVFITKRRDNPDFTLEDARKVKVSELVLEPSKADPTDAGV